MVDVQDIPLHRGQSEHPKTNQAQTVTTKVTENAQSDTFKLLAVALNMHLTLYLLLFEQSM